jgi:type I restriction enzyme S subunit
MKSNYKKIGDYIQEVDERNKGLKVQQLLGLSISKQFIPSVANIIGTDMENYKIIRKNQFACSTMQVRRDKKMPVALLKEVDEAIISQAYPIFEVKDTNELSPEYLMMWFTRSEFDREACFNAVGGVRGSLEWEDFTDMQLPVPSITKQREIVKEYNVIQNRIALNQQLIQKLEETAQSIYKHWFVDFEFPDENGKPYKSNGGKMVRNEELENEIPKGWEVDCLSGVATYLNGLAMQKFPAETDEYIPVIKIRELTAGKTDDSSDKASLKIPKQYIIKDGDIIFSWSGTLKVEIWAGGIGGLNQHLFKVASRNFEKWFYYLWTIFHLKEFIRIAEGKATSLGHIKREHLKEAKVLVPQNNQISRMNNLMTKIFKSIINKKTELRILKNTNDFLLSKLATVED